MKETTIEINRQVSELKCRRAVENLLKHNFTAIYCENSAEAADYILKEAAGAESIGFGGSKSVADMDIIAKLEGTGVQILNHGNPSLSQTEKVSIMKRQQTCGLFICGVNALTTGGEIVNIDGVGNRVSATIFGPDKIILVAGRNKLVEGDICDAIRRVKSMASPPNTIRLGKDTPCAKTGICANCSSSDRICNVITVFERKPSRSDVRVLVVNEDMGF